jgi:hypothetical protein
MNYKSSLKQNDLEHKMATQIAHKGVCSLSCLDATNLHGVFF